MRKKIRLLTILTISFLFLSGLFALIYFTKDDSKSTTSVEELLGVTNLAETIPTPEETFSEPEPTELPFQEYDISLMAVGDDLLHMGIVSTGKQADGTYNFSFLFDGITDFLDKADMKIINQETILGGNDLGFSGYPYFNSPTEAGEAIAAAGFNVVLQASNHSGDQKLDGLLNCISFWDKHPEVLMCGLKRDDSDTNNDSSDIISITDDGAYVEDNETSNNIPLLTIDGFTFAILNYTYGPNSETIPASIEGHLNILCNYDKNNHLDFTTINPKVLEDIKQADSLADIVIVCPHWGTEYMTSPSSYQQTFAKQMTEAGADVIIGTHPHVVQPVAWVDADNGNRSLCYYSLGNYVSTQKQCISMLEAMAWVTFHVTEDGISLSTENTGVIPMVCQYTSGPVRFNKVYMLEDYTEELAASHGIRSYGGVTLRLSDLQKWSEEILGDFVLTKNQVLGHH